MILKPCSLKSVTKTIRVNEVGNKALKLIKLLDIKLSEGDVITGNLEDLYEVLKKVNIIDELLLGIHDNETKNENKSVFINSYINLGFNLIFDGKIEQKNNNLQARMIRDIKIENSQSNDPREIYYVQFYSGIETKEDFNNFGFLNVPKLVRGKCFSSALYLKSKEELINLCWDILLNGVINQNNLSEEEKKLVNNKIITKMEQKAIDEMNKIKE